jgi:hypothetical protein
MKKRLCVDVSIIESLTKFIETEGVEIDLTQDDGSDADVLVCDDRKESDLDTLYSGGWIKCRTALNMAKKLEIPRIQMGALLDHLKIKVRNCSLGCF